MPRLAPETTFTTLLAAGVLAIAAGSPSPAAAAGGETYLYSFANGGGALDHPSSPLTYFNGSFYGEAEVGGSANSGGIYKVSSGGTVTTLHAFNGTTDGGNPIGGLTYYNGRFYGVTHEGNGGVFAITPAGVLTMLVNFGANSAANGADPVGPLTVINGVLYGVTELGGADNLGTLFSLTLTGTETVLHSFTGSNGGLEGGQPLGGVLAVGSTLYGTTEIGGIYRTTCELAGLGCGTLYASDLSGNITTLHSFDDTDDGEYPISSLLDVGGTLYGVTQQGGTDNCGTVFSYVLGGGFATVHTFAGGLSDACAPTGGLIQDKSTLYGPANGPHSGSIFAVAPTGATTLVYIFFPAKGNDPDYPLLLQGSTLFGTTFDGGANSAGTIFGLSH